MVRIADTSELFGAVDAVAVTPNDSTDLDPGPCRALYIGGSGDVSIDIAENTAVVFVGLSAGQILPVQAVRVRSTSTTATNIVALY